MDNDGVLHVNGTRTERMYFYEGSILRIEWTNDLGCGLNPRVSCDIIIQYACEDTLSDDCSQPGRTCGPRDGVPMTNSLSDRQSANYQGAISSEPNASIPRLSRDTFSTATIPLSLTNDAQNDPRFGRHESMSYYLKCLRRERNKGLWTADQPMNITAVSTRQNPKGKRYGFECPEEAHYYPYWASSPWKDIAILTDRTDKCNEFMTESQNVKSRFECVCQGCISRNEPIPISEASCTSVGGAWQEISRHGINPPYCGSAPRTRSNYLGNVQGTLDLPHFNWTIPKNLTTGNMCVLRIRYNISNSDGNISVSGNSSQNGANSILKSREYNELETYISFNELPRVVYPSARLGLALNTDQTGKTFQDRSWSFSIRKPPSVGECAGKQIYNLNVRGKRGNIIQTFPAMEYDFVPTQIVVLEADCIHVQWTGSDYNEARNSNDGYGGPADPTSMSDGRSDRHNIVQYHSAGFLKPITSLVSEFNMFKADINRALDLAFIRQFTDDPAYCMPIEVLSALSVSAQNDFSNPIYIDNGQNFLDSSDDRDRYWKNCGRLSGVKSPYFDGGLFPVGNVGTYFYGSTRGNSFSNRNQVGVITVTNETAPTPSLPSSPQPMFSLNEMIAIGIGTGVGIPGIVCALIVAFTLLKRRTRYKTTEIYISSFGEDETRDKVAKTLTDEPSSSLASLASRSRFVAKLSNEAIDFRSIISEVATCKGFVLILSLKMFQQPRIILEILAAIQLRLPIVCVQTAGSGNYDHDQAREFMIHLDTKLDVDALSRIKELGLDPLNVAYRVSTTLPFIISKTVDPTQPESVQAVQLMEIKATVRAALKRGSEASTISPFEWLRKRGDLSVHF
jgi:hypothetical protein